MSLASHLPEIDFWKESTKEEYTKAFEKLREHWSDEEIRDLLTGLYFATAAEFGE